LIEWIGFHGKTFRVPSLRLIHAKNFLVLSAHGVTTPDGLDLRSQV
jgi:hypothetical protein